MAVSTDTDEDSSSEAPEASNSAAIKISRQFLWLAAFIVMAFTVGMGLLVTKLAGKDSPPAVNTALVTVKATAGPTPSFTPTPDGVIKVQISGEVVKPGVYQMQLGDRVLDLVKKAG